MKAAYIRKRSVVASALGLLLLASLLLGACERPDRQIEAIKERGTLHVLTRNSPTTYYIGRDDTPQGFEYDLVESYARSLGVTVEYEALASVAEILDRLEAGEGDIGAAGISRTRQRRDRVLSGPGYQTVEQQVICRRGGAHPRGVEDLAGLSLRVAAGTSYHERLAELQQSYEDLHFEVSTDAATERLLRAVWERKLDCTVADSDLVAVLRRYYPELEVRFTLGAPDTLAWAFSPGATGLQKSVQNWFREFEQSGELERVLERYYGFYEVFDYVDLRVFHRRTVERLPRYENHFRAAAEQNGLDWMLLAAVGYQESQWNPGARSPTGVRGLMMLTLNTAKSVGVDNRLDAVQSIQGGARFLRRMHDWLDEEIPEPDRTWLALATYNIGMGHMRDAMALAERLGRNPHYWRDMREVLPLLADPNYFNDLRFGYARGHEPVLYVQRIRDFEDILRRLREDS
jgi:membrane-bound lytic murein transglycosylase F